jgi:hypothetical protein
VVESLLALDRGGEAVSIIDDCVHRAKGRGQLQNLVVKLMSLRAFHFNRAKDLAGCRETAEIWEKLGRTDAPGYYNAACYRANVAALLRADAKSNDNAKQADAEADRAMNWLRKAVAAGYNDAANMARDSDLDVLRDREDFKKLMKEVGSKPKTPAPAGQKGKS